MDIDELIALSPKEVWWSWPHPVVDKALNAAVIATCLPKIAKFIKTQNESAEKVLALIRGRHRSITLSSFLATELSKKTGRERRSIQWLLTGGTEASNGFLLGLAEAIGADVGDMRPAHTSTWLARATALLPAIHGHYRARSPGRHRFQPAIGALIQTALLDETDHADCIALSQARLYAQFRLTYSDGRGTRHSPTMRKLLASQSESDRTRILKVAGRLQPVLSGISKDLAAQKEKNND